MPFMQSTIVASALLGLAAARPHHIRSNGFKIEQVANPRFKGATPLEQYQASLSKWSRLISNGSAITTPVNSDSEWLTPVDIGGQTFQLDFDTGSSDTWVLGAATQTGGSSHTYYTPGSSAQSVPGATWSITYGDGSSASGTVYSDTITIGGTQVTGQAIEVADTAAAAFTSGANDGLVGLAFDSINTVTPNAVPTFMDNAIAQGLAPVFTANLNPGAPGTYSFGYVDPAQHAGDVTYVPVDNSSAGFTGFWGFAPSDADAGIADTGTTLLLLSTAAVDAYWQQVAGARTVNQAGTNYYVFDCSTQLPAFSATIGGYVATVPGADINLGGNGLPAGTCFGGIQYTLAGINAIYGDVFLKSQFVVFDLGTTGSPRLGFAPKA